MYVVSFSSWELNSVALRVWTKIQVHNYIWTCTCKGRRIRARKQKQAIPNTAAAPLNMNLTERRALHNSIVMWRRPHLTTIHPSIHPDQASNGSDPSTNCIPTDLL